jgi:hypothetical protein
MKIPIYAPYAKERFETARQHQFCILIQFCTLNESSAIRKESAWDE